VGSLPGWDRNGNDDGNYNSGSTAKGGKGAKGTANCN
jgi:hypothetical protein